VLIVRQALRLEQAFRLFMRQTIIRSSLIPLTLTAHTIAHKPLTYSYPCPMAITIPSNTTSTAFQIPAQHDDQPSIEQLGVSAKVAAEMLGVCERTMRRLAKNGHVRSVRIGKRVIFSVQSLRELIDGNPDNTKS